MANPAINARNKNPMTSAAFFIGKNNRALLRSSV